MHLQGNEKKTDRRKRCRTGEGLSPVDGSRRKKARLKNKFY